MGMVFSVFLVDSVYGVSINIILDLVQRVLRLWDIISVMIKFQVFGGIIVIVSCVWGIIIMGGVKGVGEFIILVVVLFLVGIFVVDFVFLYCFF